MATVAARFRNDAIKKAPGTVIDTRSVQYIRKQLHTLFHYALPLAKT